MMLNNEKSYQSIYVINKVHKQEKLKHLYIFLLTLLVEVKMLLEFDGVILKMKLDQLFLHKDHVQKVPHVPLAGGF